MTAPDELVARNTAFAASRFRPGLSINPAGSMMVIGCVDPRVDPAAVLGLEQGEAAVIRNVGGRLTPGTLRQLGMLSKVSLAHRPPMPEPTEAEADPAPASASAPGSAPATADWNLVILHHTDCGMHDIAPFPALLAEYFEVPEGELAGRFVTDARRSVAADVELASRVLHGDRFFVSGLVYDVDSGLVELVVPPTAVQPAPTPPAVQPV